MKYTKTMSITIIALMTAILCVLAPISIPISTVPISMGTFAVYLCATILGPKKGVVCVLIYLLLGAIGLPVYAGGAAGVGVIAGPTGGYLVGFLFLAFFTGWFSYHFANKAIILCLGMIIGTLLCYLIGTIWLGFSLHLGTWESLMAGVIPFIPGDILKMIACTVISIPIKRQLHTYLIAKKNS